MKAKIKSEQEIIEILESRGLGKFIQELGGEKVLEDKESLKGKIYENIFEIEESDLEDFGPEEIGEEKLDSFREAFRGCKWFSFGVGDYTFIMPEDCFWILKNKLDKVLDKN